MHFLPEAIAHLEQYPWPGNVRELGNLVERLTILYPNRVIGKEELPWRIRSDLPYLTEEDALQALERKRLLKILGQNTAFKTEQIDLKKHLIRTELALINQALQESDWVVARAANQLSMRRTTLVEKIKKYGLSRPESL